MMNVRNPLDIRLIQTVYHSRHRHPLLLKKMVLGLNNRNNISIKKIITTTDKVIVDDRRYNPVIQGMYFI
jgi:hypothetical protein